MIIIAIVTFVILNMCFGSCCFDSGMSYSALLSTSVYEIKCVKCVLLEILTLYV